MPQEIEHQGSELPVLFFQIGEPDRVSLGQKGSGESGYLGAPAAIASAVNDALAPLGKSIDTLPMRVRDIEALLNGQTD